jgi:hypothetical protein
MASSKKAIFSFFIFLILYFLYSVLHVHIPDVYLLRRLDVFYYIVVGVFFTLYLKERLIHKSLRRVILHVGVLWTIWFILELLYFFPFPDTAIYMRNVWYFYFAPMHILPLLLFYASIYEGRLENERLHPLWYLPTLISLFFVFAAISNDKLHLMMDFEEDFKGIVGNVEYGPIYYLSMAWIVFLFTFSFVLTLIKCRISIPRRLQFLPLLPVLVGIVWAIYYITDTLPVINGRVVAEFPETFSYIMGSFTTICICIGLYPSNEGYKALFAKSSIAALITDRDGTVRYTGSTPISLAGLSFTEDNEEQVRGTFRIRRFPIRGGFMYWQEDISEILKLNEELKETGDRLAEEGELIKLKRKLDAERYSIDESNKLYDSIAKHVLPQSAEIARLSEEAEADLSLFDHHASVILVLCTYIKRYSNLTLLHEKNAFFSSSELTLSLNESLRALQRNGIKTALISGESALLPGSSVIELYSIFEELFEKNLNRLIGVTIRVSKGSPFTIKAVIETDSELSLPASEYFNVSMEKEDGIYYLVFALKEMGGDAS